MSKNHEIFLSKSGMTVIVLRLEDECDETIVCCLINPDIRSPRNIRILPNYRRTLINAE